MSNTINDVNSTLLRPAYDRISEWYDQSVEGGLPVHALVLGAVQELVGEIEHQQVCDLGCGQGWLTRWLAAWGAQTTGIDMSMQMLWQAKNKDLLPPHIYPIAYRYGDARHLTEIADASFDGVTCILALMDMPDLSAVLNTVARVLHPDGWFVFAITHPCFQTPDSRWTGKAGGTVKREVRGYFREGYWESGDPNSVRGQAGAYHRTLGTYLNTLNEAGLRLERLIEPQAQGDAAERVPGYKEAPPVLAARCRKS